MGLSYRTVEGKSAAHLHDLRLDDGALSIRLEAQKIMKKTPMNLPPKFMKQMEIPYLLLIFFKEIRMSHSCGKVS